jgi:hypothetical protein
MHRSLTATALVFVLIAAVTLDSRPASAQMEGYPSLEVMLVGAAVLAGLTLVPTIGNAVELANGYGSPPGWTIYGGIVGGLQLTSGVIVAMEGDATGPALLLIGLGALNLALAIAGATDYVPPAERLSLGPAPVVDQRGRLTPGVGLSWQF